MADRKLSELEPAVRLDGDDIVYAVENPSGTARSKKATLDTVRKTVSHDLGTPVDRAIAASDTLPAGTDTYLLVVPAGIVRPGNGYFNSNMVETDEFSSITAANPRDGLIVHLVTDSVFTIRAVSGRQNSENSIVLNAGGKRRLSAVHPLSLVRYAGKWYELGDDHGDGEQIFIPNGRVNTYIDGGNSIVRGNGVGLYHINGIYDASQSTGGSFLMQSANVISITDTSHSYRITSIYQGGPTTARAVAFPMYIGVEYTSDVAGTPTMISAPIPDSARTDINSVVAADQTVSRTISAESMNSAGRSGARFVNVFHHTQVSPSNFNIDGIRLMTIEQGTIVRNYPEEIEMLVSTATNFNNISNTGVNNTPLGTVGAGTSVCPIFGTTSYMDPIYEIDAANQRVKVMRPGWYQVHLQATFDNATSDQGGPGTGSYNQRAVIEVSLWTSTSAAPDTYTWSGERYVAYKRNFPNVHSSRIAQATFVASAHFVSIVRLDAGDYIQVRCRDIATNWPSTSAVPLKLGQGTKIVINRLTKAV